MKRLAIWTAVVFVLFLLSGCGEGGGERPADQITAAEAESSAAPSAARSSEPESAAPPEVAGKDHKPDAPTEVKEDSRITTREELDAALKAKNPEFKGGAAVKSDGRNIVMVAINDPAIEDISPLAGLPLQALDLARCHITDISPLKGMQLQILYLEETGVRDLSALEGMPLVELGLNNTPVDDIRPLKGAPLEKLYLVGTRVEDLSPLRGAARLDSLWLNDTPVSDIGPLESVPSLVSLTLAGTKVSDLSALKRLRLRRLHIARSEVTDLGPLKWLQLERLVFTPGKIEKGIEYAQKMPTIREIGTSFGEEARPSDLMPPYVFWEQYDAGKFK